MLELHMIANCDFKEPETNYSISVERYLGNIPLGRALKEIETISIERWNFKVAICYDSVKFRITDTKIYIELPDDTCADQVAVKCQNYDQVYLISKEFSLACVGLYPDTYYRISVWIDVPNNISIVEALIMEASLKRTFFKDIKTSSRMLTSTIKPKEAEMLQLKKGVTNPVLIKQIISYVIVVKALLIILIIVIIIGLKCLCKYNQKTKEIKLFATLRKQNFEPPLTMKLSTFDEETHLASEV